MGSSGAQSLFTAEFRPHQKWPDFRKSLAFCALAAAVLRFRPCAICSLGIVLRRCMHGFGLIRGYPAQIRLGEKKCPPDFRISAMYFSECFPLSPCARALLRPGEARGQHWGAESFYSRILPSPKMAGFPQKSCVLRAGRRGAAMSAARNLLIGHRAASLHAWIRLNPRLPGANRPRGKKVSAGFPDFGNVLF